MEHSSCKLVSDDTVFDPPHDLQQKRFSSSEERGACLVGVSPRESGVQTSTSDNVPSDSGGGSGGGQGGGGGKKQKSGSESSNSSQQSGGGGGGGGGTRSSGGRRAAGGSCSGSSESSGDDEEDEDERRRRPPHGREEGNKEGKPKLVDEDDEATDSADEGMDDATPNSMVMDFSPSNQSENDGPDTTTKSSHFPSGMGNYAHSPPSSAEAEDGSHRPTSLTPNHFQTKTTTLCSGIAGGEVVETLISSSQGSSGTVAIETMGPKESSSSVECSSAINMIVGYGVPVSTPSQAAQPLDKAESDLGTPTQDSPSPPTLGDEEKMTPLPTPVPVTPVLSPALTTLLPQVSQF